LIIAAILAAFVLDGCSAIRQYAAGSLGDALAGGGDVYARDDDVDLIGAATPFGLKTIESLLESAPRHPGLLLAAARGFTQYAYVYVQLPAEDAEDRDVASSYAQKERARRLYLRARDYGLRGLEAGPDDVAMLYWTALAWMAAISLSKDDPGILAGIPRAQALVARAHAREPDFDRGALQTFLIGYEVSRPDAAANATDRSRAHFKRAVELSSGRHAGPYVALAESVAIAEHDRRAFESLLQQALQVDVDARPEWRLANIVMQRRARRLLRHADEFFAD
jgi:predicted anti-sigma-YlaC factor YlaD